MTWMVIIPPRMLMVRDSAAQTSNGKQISVGYSFRNPEGSTSYTSADTPAITAYLLLLQFCGKERWGLPSSEG
jgi:hypothetical protein